MKKIMMMLVAGLLAFGAAEQSASASTFDLGTLNPGTTNGFVVNIGSDIKTFSDTINFSLAGLQSSLAGSLTDRSSFFGIPVNSLDFTLDLFNKSAPATSLGTFVDATGTSLAFSYLNLAAGDYFFRISGKIDPTKIGNSYDYRFEVSQVPLPPALLLFATALGGMAVFGYRRRNTQV